MASDTSLQTITQNDIDVYSKEMLTELNKREKAVRTALNGIDKNMEKIAFNLYWIYTNKAYKAMGFESIMDYALKTFDLGKSNTYSFISLVERFAAHSEDGSIADKFDDKYKGYSSSKLSLLVDLSDDQIEELGISPDMSVRDMKDLLKKAAKTARDNAVQNIRERFEKKDTAENTADTEQNGQSVMNIEDNEISVPSISEPDEDNDRDGDGIIDYAADTVYEFSTQDDERSIMEEIKVILKKYKTDEYKDLSFSLVLCHPVRKGEE